MSRVINRPFAFCHFCGKDTKSAVQTVDGLHCQSCNNVMWSNPTPVGGLIIKADENGGVFVVRRKQPPAKGKLVIPAGFQTFTSLRQETWQQTAVREANEEANIDCTVVDDEHSTQTVRHILTETGHHYGDGKMVVEPRLLILGAFTGTPAVSDFEEDDEVSERLIIHPDSDELLGFSIHRKALAMYWESIGFADHNSIE